MLSCVLALFVFNKWSLFVLFFSSLSFIFVFQFFCFANFKIEFEFSKEEKKSLQKRPSRVGECMLNRWVVEWYIGHCDSACGAAEQLCQDYKAVEVASRT